LSGGIKFGRTYKTRLEMHLNVTFASGTGTSPLSTIVKDITITNETGQEVAYILGSSLDTLAIASKAVALVETSRFSIASGVQVPMTYGDPVVAASVTDYYAWWDVFTPWKGNSFTTVVNLNAVTALAGLVTPSAMSVDANVIFAETHDTYMPYLNVLAKQLFTNTNFSLTDKAMGSTAAYGMVAISGTEISSVTSGLEFGDDALNTVQIVAAENETNTLIAGSGKVFAASGQIYTDGIVDPLTTSTGLYAVLWKLPPGGGKIVLATTSSESPFFVAWLK